MNPQDLFARLKSLSGSLSWAQLASLALSFVLVVAVVAGSAYWLNTPTFRLLFADMDPESAAQVVQRLRDQDVSYELVDAGRSIRVPEDQLDQLRLDFAAQGLPNSGRIGFEIFDRTQFGATEFLEQVNYRRALEGEIARTIGTIAEVGGARVHIAMAKDSLFQSRQQPAKASVVLKLRNQNRPLSTATVSGIASLVAASVEGLRPEHVVVVDTFGRPLSRPSDDAGEPLGAAQLERQQRFEKDLAASVVSLLEPVVGPDRVRVNVAARLHIDSEDQIEERWDPTAVIRSRATTLEGNNVQSAQGIAGARANLPGVVPPGSNEPAPSPVEAAQVLPAGVGRSTDTTNYEVSKVVRHTVRPRGDVARLSVAVILDNDHAVQRAQDGTVTRSTKPREGAEIEKIRGIVAAAVGLDTTRGDSLTVENVPFEEGDQLEPDAPTFFERYGTRIDQSVRVLVVLVLGMLAVFMVGRPLARRAFAETSTRGARPGQTLPQLPQPRSIAELEGEIEKQLDYEAAVRAGDRKLPVLAKRILGMAKSDPENAARLVRSWMLEERK